MARNIRWRIPFYSLNGTECRVDIYVDGYNGGVTILKGGNIPIYWDEDDDEDLLNVIRYKTGYISVIEESYGALSDLYPLHATDRYVRFYYGQTLAFTGYIQPQSFENEWIDGPRVVNLPIISPLGLASGMKFQKQDPSITTLGTLLIEAVRGLNADYNSIIFPSLDVNLSANINKIIVSPFNNDFEQISSSTWDDLYDPISYEEFIEGICHCFGCIVHDNPASVVFSRIDHYGNYLEYELIPLHILIPSEVQTFNNRLLTDYFTHRDAEGNHSKVMPLKELTLNYEGENPESVTFSLCHAKENGDSNRYPSQYLWLKMVGPELSGPKLLESNTINTHTLRPVSAGVMASYAGGSDGTFGPKGTSGNTAEPVERILFKYDNTIASTANLFTCLFPTYPYGRVVTLGIQMRWGDQAAHLGNDELSNNIMLKASIDIGNTVIERAVVIDKKTGYGYAQIQVNDGSSGQSQFGGVYGGGFSLMPNSIVKVTISLNPDYTGWRDDMLYSFDAITLQRSVSDRAKYYEQTSNTDKLPGDEGSMDEGSIDLLFSMFRKNSNMVGSDIKSASQTTPYLYLFTSQDRLQTKFTRGTIYPSDLYLGRWQYWISGWRWRIIACGMNPIDDEYTLTLHHSTTID